MSKINFKHTTYPISNAHITTDSLDLAVTTSHRPGSMDQTGIKTPSESEDTSRLSERVRSFQATGIFGLLAVKL